VNGRGSVISTLLPPIPQTKKALTYVGACHFEAGYGSGVNTYQCADRIPLKCKRPTEVSRKMVVRDDFITNSEIDNGLAH
jgi:hypothetical protein